MINKKNLKQALANTFALTSLMVWVVCAIFVWLLPGVSMEIANSWMHGLDMRSMGDWNLSLGSFLAGGITLGTAAWGVGWVAGWSWEKVNGKS